MISGKGMPWGDGLDDTGEKHEKKFEITLCYNQNYKFVQIVDYVR
jgi:hypothetical protein